MGVTLGVLPLLAYSYGKGDRARLMSALRVPALTVGGIVPTAQIPCSLPRPGVRRVRGGHVPRQPSGVTILTAQSSR